MHLSINTQLSPTCRWAYTDINLSEIQRIQNAMHILFMISNLVNLKTALYAIYTTGEHYTFNLGEDAVFNRINLFKVNLHVYLALHVCTALTKPCMVTRFATSTVWTFTPPDWVWKTWSYIYNKPWGDESIKNKAFNSGLQLRSGPSSPTSSATTREHQTLWPGDCGSDKTDAARGYKGLVVIYMIHFHEFNNKLTIALWTELFT